jgi:hypothetical protein
VGERRAVKQRLALANDAKTCKSMGCKNNGGKGREGKDGGGPVWRG